MTDSNSDNEKVGYGRPPKQHQFKPGNQAARGRRTRQKALSMPEIIQQALNTKRMVKRGGRTVPMYAKEILVERLVSTMVGGSAREVVMMVNLIKEHVPQFLEQEVGEMMMIYHQAGGPAVALPSAINEEPTR